MHSVNISIILCELGMTRFFFWKLASRVLQGFSVTVPFVSFYAFSFCSFIFNLIQNRRSSSTVIYFLVYVKLAGCGPI